MNIYRNTDQSSGTDDEAGTPSHYNWLLMLIAAIIYLIVSLSF